MLDFKNSQTSKAILIERYSHPSILRFFKNIFFVGFVLCLISCLVFFFWKSISVPREKILGIFLILFSLWGILWLFLSFFNQKLEKSRIEESDNLADFLDLRAAKAVISALSFRKYSFDLSLFLILVGMTDLSFTFSRFLLSQDRAYEITEDIWKREGIDETDSFQAAEKTISEALRVAFDQREEKISVFHLLFVIIENNPLIGKILFHLGISKDDLLEVILWQERVQRLKERRKKFWLKRNLLRKRGVGRQWTAGYTPFLDLYSSDITETVKSMTPSEVALHAKQISQLEDALIKPEDNCALLVGELGTGRKMIISNLANKLLEGRSYKALNFNRIVEIDMTSLIAASQSMEELEVNLKTAFNEAVNAENVILIIREIHNYIGGYFGAKEVAKVDISGILSEYITYPTFRLIGVTTPEGFTRALHKAKDIVSRFVKIEVPSASPKEALLVLEEATLEIERQTKLLITFPALKEIINLTDRYIGNVPFPKKALDLLNEIVIYKARGKGKIPGIVLADEVAVFVSEKIEIPVGEASEKEKEVLLNLEKIIHERLINQEEAISEVANALRRARADIKAKKRTLGNFLFLGPTGVGKTETSKCLARAYFGSEKRIIRLDMSEYQEVDSITRLIGDEENPGYFTTMVREDPFSLILLDEIEKANLNILNLFLQVLDEGHLTDGAGRMVDFKNTIIIATSNAGSELILNAIREGRDLVEYKEDFINEILKRGIFRPEFLNRFDAIVLFRTLSKEDLQKVAELMLNEIKDGLYQKEIELTITSGLVEKVAELGFSPEFGAREMRRVIQEKVENVIAKAIISNTIKTGDKIEINPETFEVKMIED